MLGDGSLLKRLILGVLLSASAQLGLAAAPALQLPDLGGKVYRLADYRGKWVVVNYWATWCPPCREELPELEVFYSNNRDHAVVLGINMEDIDETRLKQFVDDQFLSYPILLGSRAAANAIGDGVRALPTTYLVAPSGEVVARRVGGITAAALERFIAQYSPTQGS